jgi:PAS domain-containing protein
MNENEVNNLISENISLKAELLVLREKNNIYQKFNQLSPDIVIVVDTNYLYQYIHIPNVPAIVLDGLLGKDIISTTPAVLRPAMVEALEKVSKRKEVVVYESEGESMGSYKYYLNYLAPILDEKNNVTHIYFLSKDITTQKKSEIENKSLQQKLNTLFQSTKHIYTIFDTERNVIWFNEESKRITNLAFNINIKIGSNAKDEFSPTVFESFNQQFEKAKLGSPVKYTRKYLIENEHIFYEFTFYPIIENGIPIAIAHVGIDVTELAIKEENSKNINRQLVLQNQQLNQYSNIISHNLRGPISTLMGIANVIDKCNDDQMAKEILFGQIKPIIEKLDRIIIDMNLLVNHN